MKRKQALKKYSGPTINELSDLDRIEYRQSGYLTAKTFDCYDEHHETLWNRGYGYKLHRGRDKQVLENILSPDYCKFNQYVVTPRFTLISIDLGLITVEVFPENYLLEYDTKYLERIQKKLCKLNVPYKIIGEKKFIWISRKYMLEQIEGKELKEL